MTVRQLAAKIIELDPRSFISYTLLARVATDTWDWPTAQREVNAALERGPTAFAPLYTAAYLAYALGQNAKAERLFKAALVSDPLSSDAPSESGLGSCSIRKTPGGGKCRPYRLR